MMGLLRMIAAQRGVEFRRHLEETVGLDRVRGIHLGVDPYWMTWVKHNWRYRWDWLDGWPPYGSDSLEESHFLRRRPPDWELHCQRMGYAAGAAPILFRVIFREPSDLRTGRGPTGQIQFEDYPIICESRGTCRALDLHEVDSVGRQSPNTSGTAGGFLRDVVKNIYYLVSCAHVLGEPGETVFMPGPADLSGHVAIGRVEMSLLPPPGRQFVEDPAERELSDMLDIALASLDPGVQDQGTLPGFGNPRHVTPVHRMCAQDPVRLFGKASCRVDAEVASLCLFHEIEIDGAPRQFSDIFAIQSCEPWHLKTQLVKPGDSGAWIVRSLGAITSWDGVLFAGDGATGYACFAENVMTAISQSLPSVSLIP